MPFRDHHHHEHLSFLIGNRRPGSRGKMTSAPPTSSPSHVHYTPGRRGSDRTAQPPRRVFPKTRWRFPHGVPLPKGSTVMLNADLANMPAPTAWACHRNWDAPPDRRRPSRFARSLTAASRITVAGRCADTCRSCRRSCFRVGSGLSSSICPPLWPCRTG